MSDPEIIDPDPPSHLARYLLESERVVVAVRRHPAQVFEPVGSAVVALLVILVVHGELPVDLRVIADVLWVPWLVLLVRAIIRFWQWRVDWFVATDNRLLLSFGVVNRKVAMMPLAKVTDMSYNRTPFGRLLGYGEFVLESAGQDQALHVVSWLPSPDELYRLICAEIFDPRRFRRRPGASGWQDGRGVTLRRADDAPPEPEPSPAAPAPAPAPTHRVARPEHHPTIDISDN